MGIQEPLKPILRLPILTHIYVMVLNPRSPIIFNPLKISSNFTQPVFKANPQN